MLVYPLNLLPSSVHCGIYIGGFWLPFFDCFCLVFCWWVVLFWVVFFFEWVLSIVRYSQKTDGEVVQQLQHITGCALIALHWEVLHKVEHSQLQPFLPVSSAELVVCVIIKTLLCQVLLSHAQILETMGFLS